MPDCLLPPPPHHHHQATLRRLQSDLDVKLNRASKDAKEAAGGGNAACRVTVHMQCYKYHRRV
jgi:hypothetical protein